MCGVGQVVRNTLVNETYVLYQCGLPAPSLSQFPAGSKLFSIPLDSVAVLETVPLAYMVRKPVFSRTLSWFWFMPAPALAHVRLSLYCNAQLNMAQGHTTR